LLNQLPADPEAYFAQGITWFVLEPADTKLLRHVDAWIGKGKAREVQRFGKLRVVKLDSGVLGEARTE
jgi:hypothetical protein